MSHASAGVETAADGLNQKLFVQVPRTPAGNARAVGTDIDGLGQFKPASLRNRELHKHPHEDAAFSA